MITVLSIFSTLLAVLTDEEEFDSPYDAWKDDPYAIIDALMRQENYERIGEILGPIKFAQYIMAYCRKEIEEFNKDFDWSIPHPVDDFSFLAPNNWWLTSIRFKLLSAHKKLFQSTKPCVMDATSISLRYTVYSSAYSYEAIDSDSQLAPGWDGYVEDNNLGTKIYLPKINCNEKVYFRSSYARYSETVIEVSILRNIEDRPSFQRLFGFRLRFLSDHAKRTLQKNGFIYVPISFDKMIKRASLTDSEIIFVNYVEPFFGVLKDTEIFNAIPSDLRKLIKPEVIGKWRRKCLVEKVK